MTHFTDTFSTPFGLFSVAVNRDGAVVATAFGSAETLRERHPSRGARADDSRRVLADSAPDKNTLERVREQVLAYCAGERAEFSLPLGIEGTQFQKQVWAALREIPFGETRSYGQLAAQLGRRSASRAVGRANATNPICLIVPCHRVIGADGSLTGFAFGEDIKRRLLLHERSVALRSRAA
jgi:methylated-DNA-[protein]-cysteine S-methyltransferase